MTNCPAAIDIATDRLRFSFEKLRNRIFPGALILMYHRVTELGTDPWGLAIHPKNFEEQLEVLKTHGIPIQLAELNQILYSVGDLRSRVIVTFDDGYADNFYHAKPLLEKYNIPATFFIATAGIGRLKEFWWDELDRIFLQPGTLPSLLELSIGDKLYKWTLNTHATYTDVDYENHQDWSAETTSSPTDRHLLYRQIYTLLASVSVQERQSLLATLRQWAKTDEIGRPTHRTLSLEELVVLGESELIEIGAHTSTHPFLSELSAEDQRREIKASKDYLEDILMRPIQTFSYPHGRYTKESVDIVKELGFHCACSSLVGNIRPGVDRFLLPRVVVGNWNGDEFSKWLLGWIGK